MKREAKEQVLIDTTGIWGLFIGNSAYHGFMKKLRAEKILVIPSAIILENIYPVYQIFSEEYAKPQKGLEKLQGLARFYWAMLMEEEVKIHSSTTEDIAFALRIANEDKDLFIDRNGKLKLFDALIGATWMRTKLPLYTTDEELRRFGERHRLESRIIKKG
jgi:predicted nucleic acid-binding protein